MGDIGKCVGDFLPSREHSDHKWFPYTRSYKCKTAGHNIVREGNRRFQCSSLFDIHP